MTALLTPVAHAATFVPTHPERDGDERLFPVVMPVRFNTDDVLNAFGLVDKTRINTGADLSGMCVYWTGIVPDCIAGTIIHLLAPNVAKELKEGYAIGEQSMVLSASFTPDAIDLLGLAQHQADGGRTWGEAMFAAMRLMLREKTSPKF